MESVQTIPITNSIISTTKMNPAQVDIDPNDPNLHNEYCMRALKLLESMLIKSSVDQFTNQKKQEALDDKQKPKKELMNDAYIKFLCIRFQVLTAKKNVCTDNMPVQVTSNLFIGSIGAAMHRDN